MSFIYRSDDRRSFPAFLICDYKGETVYTQRTTTIDHKVFIRNKNIISQFLQNI